jgi:hypothetical protein
MPQSIFAANATQFIDGVDTDFAPAGLWNLGVQYLGATKAFVRRCLGGFDLFGPAAAGRPLAPSDSITAAELLLDVIGVAGPAGWPAAIERLTRADWDYTAADWLRYRTGATWTAPGGDVAPPPPAAPFTSPALPGEQVAPGMLAFVTDAIADRGGIVLLRLKASDEAPAQSQWVAYQANLASPTRPRLRVTYVAAEPSPIAGPGGFTLESARPARAERARVERGVSPESPAAPEDVKPRRGVEIAKREKVRNEQEVQIELLVHPSDERRPATGDRRPATGGQRPNPNA